MRQVPHYLIIGNGRVARHFAQYFSKLSLSYSSWSRSSSANLQDHLPQATHILLLISDSAIDDFYLKHLQTVDAIVLHFSGALSSQYVIGSHPLMTFAQDLYPLEQYQAITFVVDDDAPSAEILLPGLPNPIQRLPQALKARYHALAVMAGNFTCILWQKLFKDFAEVLHIDPKSAIPYLQQQTTNLIQNPKSALTGPLVRQDHATIQKNLQALQHDPFQAVYQSFVDCYAAIQPEESHS